MRANKRHRQLSRAQEQYRSKKRVDGCQRIQTWLKPETIQQLRELCATLNKSQADVLAIALARMEKEFTSYGTD